MTANYLLYSWMTIETMLRDVTEMKLRQPAPMTRQRSQCDDASDRTFCSRCGHSCRAGIGRNIDWQFTMRVPLALEHRRYFDLLTCCTAVDDRFQLASLWNSRSTPKDSWWFVLRLPVAWNHSQYLDLLIFRPGAEETIRVSWRWTSTSKSKLSWWVCKKTECPTC